MDRIAPDIDFKTELADLFDLSGKVAYVPGGYGGIGEAIAWGLALRGARVMVAGRDPGKALTLAGAIVDAGYEAAGLGVDVTSVDAIGASVDAVVERFGGLDLLINCIGIQREQPLLEVTEDAFDEVYRVNLKAAMFLSQAAARHQVAAGNGGRHVHLLSVRAQLGLRDRGYSAYCSTKGGLVMLIKQHAMELAPHGITVNGVAPTFVYTEMIRHVMDNPEFRDYLLSRIPLGRIADPKDVAGPVLFFASPAAGFVTGQTLYVDGGITSSQ
jgi:gluconate 5-dehydrogenase